MGFLGTSLIFAVIKIIASLLVRICCSRSPYTNSMMTSIKHFKKAEKSMKTMEANAIMVAGSYRRKVLVMIRHDSDNGPKHVKHLNGQICQICGDTVGLTAARDIFVAYNK